MKVCEEEFTVRMKAAVMERVNEPLIIEEVELDAPKSREVLVQIKATAVCHSDLNSLQDESTPTPTILGHEGAGIVVEVGDSVTTVKPGDKVALNWTPFCGICKYCRTGQVNLCEVSFKPIFSGTLLDGTTRLRYKGKTMYHNSILSTFAEYTVVPEMSCIKLPDGIPFPQASLIGCGVATGFGAAVKAAQVKPGSIVTILGIGGVGVNAIQGAKIAGASKIIACDLKEQNLEIAKSFGATHTINVKNTDLVEEIKELTDGFGTDYAIDCTGNTTSASLAWEATRKGGTTVVVGAFNSNNGFTLPAGGFHQSGKLLKGSFYGDIHPFQDFPLIAQMYLEGKYKLDELVLSKIKLEDINDALNAFKDRNSVNVGRNIIVFN